MKIHLRLLVVLILTGTLIITTFSCTPVQIKPQPVTPEPPIVYKGERKCYGPAWVEKRNGVYLLHLKGTEYEMGYQHGVLMREEIMDGALPFFHTYLETVVESSFLGRNQLTQQLGVTFMDQFITAPLSKGISGADREAYNGIADSMGLDRRLAGQLAVVPDALQTMIGMFYQKSAPKTCPPTTGCTALAVSGKASKDGSLIVGRNLDYEGTGVFDKYLSVIFCEPDEGQKYVMFSSAGVHTPALTGWNESGISFHVHTNLTADVSRRGHLLTSIGGRVIREAENIYQALNIIYEMPPACGWTFVITDAKTSEAVAVETSNKDFHLRRMVDDALWVSNQYLSEKLQEREINLSPVVAECNWARYNRMQQLIKENYGEITPEMAAGFLGDHLDLNSGKERATGNVIAQMINVLSVVLEPQKKRFWIAVEPAPVCNTKYIGFDIEKEFAGETDYQLPAFTSPYYESVIWEGLRLFVQANEVYTYKDNKAEAAGLLEQARIFDSSEPYYPFVEGIVRLELGEYEKGLDLLIKAHGLFDSSYRKDQVVLWWARALDLNGRRKEAVHKYTALSEGEYVDEHLRELASGNLKRPFSPSCLKHVPLNFYLAEVFE